MNVYYDPEKFGLTTVAAIDYSDGCYQFDYLVVWKNEAGDLLYAEDAGCSCPCPFEDIGVQELTKVQNYSEILSRMEYRLSQMDDYDRGERPRVEAAIDEFKSKARRGDL